MNAEPRLVLYSLMEQYGNDLIQDHRKLRGLLSDLCGKYKTENYGLEVAVMEGVAGELSTISDQAALLTVMPRLRRRMETNRGLSEDLARWTVESWAVALKLLTTDQLPFPTTYTSEMEAATATDEESGDPVEPYVRGKLRSTGVHELYLRLTLLL